MDIIVSGISFDTDFALPGDNERDVGSLTTVETDNRKDLRSVKFGI